MHRPGDLVKNPEVGAARVQAGERLPASSRNGDVREFAPRRRDRRRVGLDDEARDVHTGDRASERGELTPPGALQPHVELERAAQRRSRLDRAPQC